jgi:ubiquinone/menaquinone biosynthesis C-methylase UbiE
MSLDNGYVTSEYLKNVADRMRAFKQLSYEHMSLTTGDTVLDVGCGPAVDTIALAQLVGSNGKVIGIDADQNMLSEAEQVAQDAGCSERVVHMNGSALKLPLADASVGASRAERLLQVLPVEHEQTIVAELIRVTRCGGRVVLADADWASASVDFSNSELERRLMEFFTLIMRPNGLAGRHLPTLCHDHGLSDLRIDVVPMVQQRFDETPFANWLIDMALKKEIINDDEASLWLSELQQRDQQGRFYSCVNMVIASGRKHP